MNSYHQEFSTHIIKILNSFYLGEDTTNMSSKVTLGTVIHGVCRISRLLTCITVILSPSLLLDKLGQGNIVKVAVILNPLWETKIGAGQMNSIFAIWDCADEDRCVTVRQVTDSTFLLEGGILIEEEVVLSIS